MPYFRNFNYILYPDFQDENNNIILKNLTSRVVRKFSPVNDVSLFYLYTIAEGKTIESVSEELYGTVDYYWTILLANNLFDRGYDYPLTYGEFSDYIIEKYGSIENSENTFKYYIRPSVEINSSNPQEDLKNFIEVPGDSPITVGILTYETWNDFPTVINGITVKYKKSLYEVEVDINEEKRTFYVVDSRYINSFVKEFERLIS